MEAKAAHFSSFTLHTHSTFSLAGLLILIHFILRLVQREKESLFVAQVEVVPVLEQEEKEKAQTETRLTVSISFSFTHQNQLML